VLKYTPKQARALAGLTAETLRYWRHRLKPIRSCRGHGPVFTFGDVVALRVIERLVRVFGLHIGSIEPVAESLFEQCNRRNWLRADNQFVILDLLGKTIDIKASSIEAVLSGPSIVLPLRHLVEELNRQLTADQRSHDQNVFSFDRLTEETFV
jgi:hypothetical protein